MNEDQNDDHKPLTMREMLQSMLAGALGVQTGKNRTRDFSRGKPSQFIMLGLLFMLLFVLIVLGAVKLVLHFASA
ncbi:hypothetical protein D3C77_760130 [compost metagenome]